MTTKTTTIVFCDYCGVEIKNEEEHVSIFPDSQFFISKGTASKPFDKEQDFCSRLCVCVWFLKIFGYKDGEFTITD